VQNANVYRPRGGGRKKRVATRASTLPVYDLGTRDEEITSCTLL
jgi:hypothetical protein